MPMMMAPPMLTNPAAGVMATRPPDGAGREAQDRGLSGMHPFNGHPGNGRDCCRGIGIEEGSAGQAVRRQG